MHTAVIAAVWLGSISAVVFVCRRRWAHRCAECGWRHRETHTTGRHRARRLTLPARPSDTGELPPAADPDATAPMLPAPAQPYPSPYPRALPTGRR